MYHELFLCFFFAEHRHYKLRNDLYTACKTGDIEKLQALLSAVTIHSEEEHSPAKEDQIPEDGEERLKPEEMSVLLNRPVGDRGRTLLHLVSAEGHKEAVVVLMEAGADPTIK